MALSDIAFCARGYKSWAEGYDVISMSETYLGWPSPFWGGVQIHRNLTKKYDLYFMRQGFASTHVLKIITCTKIQVR